MKNRKVISKVKTQKGYKYVLECLQCNKVFEIPRFIYNGGQGYYCSRECSDKASIGRKNPMKESTKKKLSDIGKKRTGEKAGNWKGGRRLNNGYVIIYSPDHPYINCNHIYVYEHRLVMEKHLGRYLTRKERIHHINRIRTDNRLKNLILFASASEHITEHNKNRKHDKQSKFIN